MFELLELQDKLCEELFRKNAVDAAKMAPEAIEAMFETAQGSVVVLNLRFVNGCNFAYARLSKGVF